MHRNIFVITIVTAAWFHASSVFATPVTYNLSGTMGFQIDGSAYVGADYRLPYEGLGPYTIGHDVTFSGQMIWDISGSATVDWGNPDWAGNQEMLSSNLTFTPQSGSSVHVTAPIDVNLDLGLFTVNEHYDPGVYINARAFNVALNPGNAAFYGTNPNSGPWYALYTDAFGLLSQNPLCFGVGTNDCTGGFNPGLFGNSPLLTSLSRDGVTSADLLGTGSKLTLGLPSVINPGAVPVSDSVTNRPGCEGAGTGPVLYFPFVDQVCYYDLLDYGVYWNEFNISNINFNANGLSSAIIPAISSSNAVPEPDAFALLGIGLVGMVINRKRKNKTRTK